MSWATSSASGTSTQGQIGTATSPSCVRISSQVRISIWGGGWRLGGCSVAPAPAPAPGPLVGTATASWSHHLWSIRHIVLALLRAAWCRPYPGGICSGQWQLKDHRSVVELLCVCSGEGARSWTQEPSRAARTPLAFRVVFREGSTCPSCCLSLSLHLPSLLPFVLSSKGFFSLLSLCYALSSLPSCFLPLSLGLLHSSLLSSCCGSRNGHFLPILP